MNRTAPLVAAAALMLAACTSSDPASGALDSQCPDPDAVSLPAMPFTGIEWLEDESGDPSLEFTGPVSVSADHAELISAGDGDPIVDGALVTLDFVVYGGADCAFQSSSRVADVAETLTFDASTVAPSLYSALSGANNGAEVLFATQDIGALPDEDGVYPTIVLAVSVSGVQVVLERAEGETVEPVLGYPAVTLAENGAPSIDFVGTLLPDEFVAQPLIQGDGPAVVEGQQISVHYTGWIWDGEMFDSSWDRGAATTFGLVRGQLIDGWIEGLAGQNVGSQVMLIIPPELGYGDVDSGPIPGGSTLVFVVDILTAF